MPKPEVANFKVQCKLDKAEAVSKNTQTMIWKEKDPLAEQREIVKRYYVGSYGQISRDSKFKEYDERAAREAKEREEKLQNSKLYSEDAKSNTNKLFEQDGGCVPLSPTPMGMGDPQYESGKELAIDPK